MAFNRIKAALVAQRNEITHSRKAARQLINDLGIRDILVEAADSKKATSDKTATAKKKK